YPHGPKDPEEWPIWPTNTEGRDLHTKNLIDDALRYILPLDLDNLSTQFGRQFKIINEITLLIERYFIGALFWGLYIKDKPISLIVTRKPCCSPNQVLGFLFIRSNAYHKPF